MITNDGAAKLLDTIQAEALEHGVSVAMCVVDASGDLIAFRRMDGVGRLSVALAQGKARTAALFRLPTADLGPLVQPGGPMYGLTSIDGLQLVCLGGGMPLARHGELRGAVAVAGASSGTDEDLVRSATAAFTVDE